RAEVHGTGLRESEMTVERAHRQVERQDVREGDHGRTAEEHRELHGVATDLAQASDGRADAVDDGTDNLAPAPSGQQHRTDHPEEDGHDEKELARSREFE